MDMTRGEILVAVKRYEDETARPVESRVTVPGFGPIELMDESLWDDASAFAEEIVENGYLDFCSAVDDFVDDLPRGTRNGFMRVSADTPDVYLDLGFHNFPMLCTERHLADMMHDKDPYGEMTSWHGLSRETVKALPELVRRPALIADNPTNAHAIIAVLPRLDRDGYPLVAPIYPNGEGYLEITSVMTNMILTVFGPDNFDEYFGSAISPGHVLYASSRGMSVLSEASGRNLFSRYSGLRRDSVLGRPRCLGDFDPRQSAVEEFLQDLVDARRTADATFTPRSLVAPPYRR